MRVRVITLLLGGVAALLWSAAPAHAKGPDAVTIDGVGLPAPISLAGPEDGPGTFPALVDQMGFFPAVFKREPDPMRPTAPTADLGPKLVVTWNVPQGPQASSLQQELYPYAAGGPLTYMAPAQRLFGAQISRGGWYVAQSSLVDLLRSVGVPDRATLEAGAQRLVARSAAASAQTASRGNDAPVWPLVAVIGGIAGSTGVLTALRHNRRRRTRLAAA